MMIGASLRFGTRAVIAFALAALFAIPQSLLAQTHVVSPSDLQKQAADASQTRIKNREKLKDFLASETAKEAMRSAHINPQQVKSAVSSLDDADLAQLAARADKAQRDFAAGALSSRDLILIILGVVVLILIIVAVR
jgi:hypothetical protein